MTPQPPRSTQEPTLDAAGLDPGIRPYVVALSDAGIETYESCEGGPGHSYAEPTIRFHGGQGEGFRTLAIAQQSAMPIASLRRAWEIIDGEPTGPHWELTFHRIPAPPPAETGQGERLNRRGNEDRAIHLIHCLRGVRFDADDSIKVRNAVLCTLHPSALPTPDATLRELAKQVCEAVNQVWMNGTVAMNMPAVFKASDALHAHLAGEPPRDTGESKACDMPKCPTCGKNDAVTAGGRTAGEFHCWTRRGEAHGCGNYFTPPAPPVPTAAATVTIPREVAEAWLRTWPALHVDSDPMRSAFATALAAAPKPGEKP